MKRVTAHNFLILILGMAGLLQASVLFSAYPPADGVPFSEFKMLSAATYPPDWALGANTFLPVDLTTIAQQIKDGQPFSYTAAMTSILNHVDQKLATSPAGMTAGQYWDDLTSGDPAVLNPSESWGDNEVTNFLMIVKKLIDMRDQATPAQIATINTWLDGATSDYVPGANGKGKQYPGAGGPTYKSSPLNIYNAKHYVFMKQLMTSIATEFVAQTNHAAVIDAIKVKIPSLRTADPAILQQIGTLVKHRLDDEDDQFFGKAGNPALQPGTPADTSLTTIELLPDLDPTNPKSSARLRQLISFVTSAPAYTNFKGSIVTDVGTFQDIQGFQTGMVTALKAPYTFQEFVESIERLSRRPNLASADLQRIVARAGLLNQKFKNVDFGVPSSDLMSRLGFALGNVRDTGVSSDALLKSPNNSIDLSRALFTSLIAAFGVEEFNPKIPATNTVIALSWMGLDPKAQPMFVTCVQKNKTQPELNSDGSTKTVGSGPEQYLEVKDDDPVNPAAQFTVVNNANTLTLMATYYYNEDAGASASHYVQFDSTGKTPRYVGVSHSTMGTASDIRDGRLKLFAAGTTDSFSSLTLAKVNSTEVTNSVAQFTMEGDLPAASFKSKLFSTAGNTTQTFGYISVGPDNVVRVFNDLTKAPAGVMANNVLTAGPFQTFKIVVLDSFYVDLGASRLETVFNKRLNAIQNAIQAAISIQAGQSDGMEKRYRAAQELLRFVNDTFATLTVRGATPTDIQKNPKWIALGKAYDTVANQLTSFVASDARLTQTLSDIDAAMSNLFSPKNFVGMPQDGQTYILYAPNVGVSGRSGNYVQVENSQISGDTNYYARASATDPLSDATHFIVHQFRDIICIESVISPGKFLKRQLVDAKAFPNWTPASQASHTRLIFDTLVNSDYKNQDNEQFHFSVREAKNMTDGSLVIQARQLVAQVAGASAAVNNVLDQDAGYIHAATSPDATPDFYLRTIDLANASTLTNVVKDNATSFHLVQMTTFYKQLASARTQTDPVQRIGSYKNLASGVTTDTDIQLLFGEVDTFIETFRVDVTTWTAFLANIPVIAAFTDLFTSFETVFKSKLIQVATAAVAAQAANGLTPATSAQPAKSAGRSDLGKSLRATERKLVTPPENFAKNVLLDGSIIALKWTSPSGMVRYLTTHTVTDAPDVANLTAAKLTNAVTANKNIPGVASSDKTTKTYLEADGLVPADARSQFRVIIKNGAVILRSLSGADLIISSPQSSTVATTQSTLKTYVGTAIDEETAILSANKEKIKGLYEQYFRKYLSRVELVTHSIAVDATPDSKFLFDPVGTAQSFSLKSRNDGGGYLSVNISDTFVTTLNPLSLESSGMKRVENVLGQEEVSYEPTSFEKFTVVPISTYISGLGVIRTESDYLTRLTKYLSYVDGGKTADERQAFVDTIGSEVDNLTSNYVDLNDTYNLANPPVAPNLGHGLWEQWGDDVANPDIDAVYTSLFNRMDTVFKSDFADRVKSIRAKYQQGLQAVIGNFAPADGSTVALRMQVYRSANGNAVAAAGNAAGASGTAAFAAAAKAKADALAKIVMKGKTQAIIDAYSLALVAEAAQPQSTRYVRIIESQIQPGVFLVGASNVGEPDDILSDMTQFKVKIKGGRIGLKPVHEGTGYLASSMPTVAQVASWVPSKKSYETIVKATGTTFDTSAPSDQEVFDLEAVAEAPNQSLSAINLKNMETGGYLGLKYVEIDPTSGSPTPKNVWPSVMQIDPKTGMVATSSTTNPASIPVLTEIDPISSAKTIYTMSKYDSTAKTVTQTTTLYILTIDSITKKITTTAAPATSTMPQLAMLDDTLMLRTLDPDKTILTGSLMPFDESPQTGTPGIFNFEMIVLTDFYTILSQARAKSIADHVEAFAQVIPLVGSDDEIRLLIKEMYKFMTDAASVTADWKTLNIDPVHSRFVQIATLVNTQFTTFLSTDTSGMQAIVNNLMAVDTGISVQDFIARYTDLQNRLKVLTIDQVTQFMFDLTRLVNNRVTGIRLDSSWTSGQDAASGQSGTGTQALFKALSTAMTTALSSQTLDNVKAIGTALHTFVTAANPSGPTGESDIANMNMVKQMFTDNSPSSYAGAFNDPTSYNTWNTTVINDLAEIDKKIAATANTPVLSGAGGLSGQTNTTLQSYLSGITQTALGIPGLNVEQLNGDGKSEHVLGLQTWIQQQVYYNNAIVKSNKQADVKSLADSVGKAIKFQELYDYVNGWIGKDFLGTNEKQYVYIFLQKLVAPIWLNLAAYEEFPITNISDLLNRALANQFKDNTEDVPLSAATLAALGGVDPIIDTTTLARTWFKRINALLQNQYLQKTPPQYPSISADVYMAKFKVMAKNAIVLALAKTPISPVMTTELLRVIALEAATTPAIAPATTPVPVVAPLGGLLSDFNSLVNYIQKYVYPTDRATQALINTALGRNSLAGGASASGAFILGDGTSAISAATPAMSSPLILGGLGGPSSAVPVQSTPASLAPSSASATGGTLGGGAD